MSSYVQVCRVKEPLPNPSTCSTTCSTKVAKQNPRDRETRPGMRHRSLHAPKSMRSALGKASAAAPHVTTSPRHHVVQMCQTSVFLQKLVLRNTSKHFETLRNTSSDVTEAAIKSQSKERSSISLLCVLSTWNCCILGILGWDVSVRQPST